MSSFFIKKEEAEEQASNYETLGFFKKSKNHLIIFILFVSGLTLLLSNYLATELNDGAVNSADTMGILIGIAIYLFFAIFIAFNHRWAIICFALLYLADKVIFIIAGVGFSISQIIFGVIAVSLAYNAFQVANALKRQKKSN